MANLTQDRFDYVAGSPDKKVIRDQFNNLCRNEQHYLVSDNLNVPVTIQTNNLASGFTIPAGAVIIGFSVIFTSAMAAQTSTTISLGVGVSSADVSLVASTQVNQTNTAIAQNVVIASNHGGIPHASGQSIGFAPAAPLLVAAAYEPYLQVIIGGAVLTTAATVKLLCEYAPMGVFSN